jgi:hypothetical protein
VSRNRPNYPAIVKAATIETMLDDKNPSSGVINLVCGHCGRMTSESVFYLYQDPAEGGPAHKEQEELLRETMGWSHSCGHCGVLNTSIDVEEYLRGQREGAAGLEELDDLFGA